jgi:hypothetical protein
MNTPALSATWFAFFMLAAWPLLGICLFSVLPPARATLWTILGGYMLLPAGLDIKIQMVPALDKYSIPALVALAGCLLAGRKSIMRGLGGIEILLLAIFLVGPFITAQFNQDPIVLPFRTIPASDIYDAVSASAAKLIVLVPFLVGRRYFRESGDAVLILRTLVLAGLVYSPLMLFEIRMSPQLHTWIYGYFPSAFDQQFRDQGFRPVVFMGHGLLVAFFAATALMAAAGLWRTGTRVIGFPNVGVAAYFAVLLALCKTLGSALYGFGLAPLIKWASVRVQIRVALILVCFSLGYPLLRTLDVIPTRWMVEVASSVSEERANSLRARFDNEKALLDRASERIWFGWGRWGRNRVFNADSGQDLSITDGRWIITLGVFGIWGFVAEFGLLAVSIFRAASALRFCKTSSEAVHLAALSLIVAVGMIDLIPNGSLDPVKWLLAGALLGRAQSLRQTSIRHSLTDAQHRKPKAKQPIFLP